MISSIDYHEQHKYMFVSDTKTKTIFRVNYSSNSIIPIIDGVGQEPAVLAVDWLNDNLYWADSGLNRISVSDFNGTARRTIHTQNINQIGAIAIDVLTAKIFWTNFGTRSVIEQSNSDGSNRNILVENTEKAVGLALDVISKTIYWSDVRKGTIETVDYYGRNHRVVVRNVKYGASIRIFEDRIYWADILDKQVLSANRFHGGGVRKLKTLNGQLMANILIKHDVIQESDGIGWGVNSV